MKRIFLTLALTLPIARALDSITLIAYNGELPLVITISGFITGAGLCWIGYIAAGKILNTNKVDTGHDSKVLNIPRISVPKGTVCENKKIEITLANGKKYWFDGENWWEQTAR